MLLERLIYCVVVVVVVVVLLGLSVIFVGCWVAGCLPPPLLFLLIFLFIFGSMGPPDAVLSVFSVRRFLSPFKIRLNENDSQDAGIGCNLKGTKKETIHILFVERVLQYQFFVSSALKIAPYFLKQKYGAVRYYLGVILTILGLASSHRLLHLWGGRCDRLP